MTTTRRRFLGMLGAATAIGGTTALAFTGESEFRDINLDEYYAWVWHDHSELEPLVAKGREWKRRLIWFHAHEDFEEALRKTAAEEVRISLVPIRHMDKEYSEANKIDITREWLWELYRRYRSDEIGDDFDK